MYSSGARRGADDRCLSSAHRARTRQATKNDGLPHSESAVQLFLGYCTSITTLRTEDNAELRGTPAICAEAVQVNKTNWISRRVRGRVHPEVFFSAQTLQG